MSALSRVLLASTAAVLLLFVAGCSSLGMTSSNQSTPKPTPMSGMTQARGYYLDIICPVLPIQKSSPSGSASLDEIHGYAKTAHVVYLHAAKLFKDPGATWPPKLQNSIDYAAEYMTRYADFMEKAVAAKTTTELQGLQRPQDDKAFRAKGEKTQGYIMNQLKIPSEPDCTGHSS